MFKQIILLSVFTIIFTDIEGNIEPKYLLMFKKKKKETRLNRVYGIYNKIRIIIDYLEGSHK